MEKQSIILAAASLHWTALKGIYNYYIKMGRYLLLWNGTLCVRNRFIRDPIWQVL
jgi:hypothetical protein